MNKQQLLRDLIDAAFDTGYYQAVMEKTNAKLTDHELKEYARLNSEAIERRRKLKDALLRL